MINFIEDNSENYAHRTVLNVINSDITLAIASNFNTAGEILTKRCCRNNGKKYIAMHLHFEDFINRTSTLCSLLNNTGIKDIRLNIAGNGIYSTDKIQEDIDKFVFNLISYAVNNPFCDFKIIEIVSGGQTGVDESGLKAGLKLGIKTTCRSPKGWKFRDINRKEISNEKLFKERFSI
jgi:hypothetical protein